MTCGVWLCPHAAVERLVHLNPLCGGAGYLDVCTDHLAQYLTESLLVPR
jgi:hypothetical protein